MILPIEILSTPVSAIFLTDLKLTFPEAWMIEVILIGVVVILVMGIMVQSRFTELEKKVDKQFQLSRENKETLDNIRTEQNWLSADLRGEVEEVLDMVKNKENKD